MSPALWEMPKVLRGAWPTKASSRCVPQHRRGGWIGLAGVLLLATVAPTSAFADDIADGRTFFLRYCASCHGVEAEGHGFVVRALAHPPSDLRHLLARNGVTLQGDVKERHARPSGSGTVIPCQRVSAGIRTELRSHFGEPYRPLRSGRSL